MKIDVVKPNFNYDSKWSFTFLYNFLLIWTKISAEYLNLLTPNVNYTWSTATLTSKIAFYIFIQQIEVPNILNMVYTVRFFSI